MFVNFTNHPSARWSDAQRKAAMRWGEIADVPFPDIPAQADADEIRALADEYAAKIRGLSPSAVLVQGEMCFTFAMVERLRELGIPALCASGSRVCKTSFGENGVTVRTSTFEFVQFRNY